MDGRMMFGVLFLCLTVLVQGQDEIKNRIKRQNRPLIVTTKLAPPFMMLKNDSTLEGNNRFEGFIADLLKEVAMETDIEFEIFPVADGKYGSRNSDNAQWDGMIGELTRREADLAAAPLTRTELREQVVDFTYPIMSAKMTALIHQDVEAETLEELVNNTEIAFGVIENSATEEALLSTLDPVLMKLWPRVNPDTGYLKSALEGAERAREGNFAFIAEEPFGDYLASQPPCNLKVTESFLITEEERTYNFALSKKEDLVNQTQIISDTIEKLDESGKIDEFYRKWFIEAGTCTGCISTLSVSLLLSALILSFSRYL